MASVEATEAAGTSSLVDDRRGAAERLPERVASGERGLASVNGGGGIATFAPAEIPESNQSHLESPLGQTRWPSCVTRLQENRDSFGRLQTPVSGRPDTNSSSSH
jgi:hypothetical protein